MIVEGSRDYNTALQLITHVCTESHAGDRPGYRYSRLGVNNA